MKLDKARFSVLELHEHLQYAVDLELWTIPFYMSAMYSIKNKSSKEYQLIRSIVNQEMLHLQCAANVANAFGLSPKINVPEYQGDKVPHLDFSLDPQDVVSEYQPYTAEIGPLDLAHINAMCLIELPEYDTQEKTNAKLNPVFFDKPTEYGTIGAFYQALLHGVELHKDEIRGGLKQVDFFAPFYRNMPNLTITEPKDAGLAQVQLLINLITDQGEGFSVEHQSVPPVFQNTADDPEPAQDHFAKFNQIKRHTLPEIFEGGGPDSEGLQGILVEQFAELTKVFQAMFNGENPSQFFPIMASVGASIRNCWQNGVTPSFGEPNTKEGK